MWRVFHGDDVHASLAAFLEMVRQEEQSGYDHVTIDAEEISTETFRELLSSSSLFGRRRIYGIRHLMYAPRIAEELVALAETLMTRGDVVITWERENVSDFSKKQSKTPSAYMGLKDKFSSSIFMQAKKFTVPDRRALFELVDTWMAGNRDKSIFMDEKLRREGFSASEIFWTLHWGVRNVALIQSLLLAGMKEQQVSSALSLSPFVFSKSLKAARADQRQRFHRALKTLVEIDAYTKRAPVKIEDAMLSFYLVA